MFVSFYIESLGSLKTFPTLTSHASSLEYNIRSRDLQTNVLIFNDAAKLTIDYQWSPITHKDSNPIAFFYILTFEIIIAVRNCTAYLVRIPVMSCRR